MSEFQGSHCYRLQAIETPWSRGGRNADAEPMDLGPLLPGVDAVIILTMQSPTGRERVRRLMKLYGKIISTLCPKAYFQINRGYKRCPKANVHSPPDDLVHATLEAFRNMQHFENILLLEDDAIFEMKGLNLRVALREVGNFILHRQKTGMPFNTYNLGAIAHALIPCGRNLNHRRIFGFMGAAQGVIWSREARTSVLQSIHIHSYVPGEMPANDDRHFVPELDTHAFTYKKPLVTQIFVPTNNSNHWRLLGPHSKEHPWKLYINSVLKQMVRWIISMIRLDRYTKPGWDIMYGYGAGIIVFTCTSIMLVVFGLSSLFLFMRNRKPAIKK